MCYTGIEPGPEEMGYPIDLKGELAWSVHWTANDRSWQIIAD